jgi:hypothetical protein
MAALVNSSELRPRLSARSLLSDRWTNPRMAEQFFGGDFGWRAELAARVM